MRTMQTLSDLAEEARDLAPDDEARRCGISMTLRTVFHALGREPHEEDVEILRKALDDVEDVRYCLLRTERAGRIFENDPAVDVHALLMRWVVRVMEADDAWTPPPRIVSSEIYNVTELFFELALPLDVGLFTTYLRACDLVLERDPEAPHPWESVALACCKQCEASPKSRRRTLRRSRFVAFMQERAPHYEGAAKLARLLAPATVVTTPDDVQDAQQPRTAHPPKASAVPPLHTTHHNAKRYGRKRQPGI